jgi:hypothetical protein
LSHAAGWARRSSRPRELRIQPPRPQQTRQRVQSTVGGGSELRVNSSFRRPFPDPDSTTPLGWRVDDPGCQRDAHSSAPRLLLQGIEGVSAALRCNDFPPEA